MPRSDASSPFRCVVRTYPAGHVTPRHEHAFPQLLYASGGVMAVDTATGSWIVPPQRGVWLPPDTWHVTRMLTAVELASLYLDDAAAAPAACEMVEVRALLRELLVAAGDIDFRRPLAPRDHLLAQLIAEELRLATRSGQPIPMPQERRLVAFCRRVLEKPASNIGIEAHAAAVGMTAKTVTRLFQRELGIPFRAWRQLVQTSYAVAHRAQGEPVKAIASRLGYTPSAFSAMIRRNLNCTPASLAPGKRRDG